MPFKPGATFAMEYKPAAGFGGFHASYNSGTQDLTITARIKITWENGKGGLAWEPGKKETFLKKLKEKVPKGWDGKWQFSCKAKGYENAKAVPKFVLEEVTGGGAHLNFVCHNESGQAGLFASTNTVHLYQNDVFSIDKQGDPKTVGMSAGGVMKAERDKVERALAALKDVTVARGTTGVWTVDPSSKLPLATFAQNLNRVDESSPKFPLTVQATSGMADKAAAMVAAVFDELKRGAPKYPLVASPVVTSKRFKNIFAPPKPTGTVAVLLAEDFQAVRQDWVYRYKVAVHEFGHCLGLPDEYQDQYPSLGTRAHDAWRALCDQAGVAANGVPKYDASIMSCGWQTSACHYVTVWDALCELSRPLVKPGDWAIERGNAPDVL